ncbi:hypothetical protein HK405_014970, partial [Cladochytrium tenue]
MAAATAPADTVAFSPLASARRPRGWKVVDSLGAGAQNGFDYVIVGGGSAGCVLAHRLSEDPAVSVLLIEAGPEGLGNDAIDIPVKFGDTMKSEVDWNFETARQPDTKHRVHYWPR